jgi:predicted small lipoprotein YifL
MKKIGVIRVFCLLIILCALLAGCGKKTPSTSPGGKKPSTPNSIQFLLPEDYCDPDDGSYYSIPKGSKVYFYLLTEDVNPVESI